MAMKKLILTLTMIAAGLTLASAQVIPSFQLGIKGGMNFSTLSSSNSTFSTSNRAGYLGGLWARVGALGFNFQPELYVTAKNVEINDNGSELMGGFLGSDDGTRKVAREREEFGSVPNQGPRPRHRTQTKATAMRAPEHENKTRLREN